MTLSAANDVNIPVVESRSRTNFEALVIRHTWTISNFSLCDKKVSDVMVSEIFGLLGNEKQNTIKWRLHFYPKGNIVENKEYLSLYLILLEAKQYSVEAEVTVGVVDAKGARRTLGTVTGAMFAIKTLHGWSKFVKLNDLLDKTRGLMLNDNLVLFCEIKMLTGISKTSECLDVIKSTEPKSQPLAKIGHLLESKKFSDVTITACGKEFQAHKIVLAQSSVFSAMFDHDMEEKKQGRIDIIDIDEEVVKEMLVFLYTGKVNNIKESAVGLLAAADKYALEDLKIMCEEALEASLTTENAADTLILGDLHSADRLKPQVINFICSFAAGVVITAGFKLMVKSHPSLIAELFCQSALRKNGDAHDI